MHRDSVKPRHVCARAATLALLAGLLAGCPEEKQDTPPGPGLALGATRLTTVEGGPGQPVTVALTAAPSAAVSVRFQLTGDEGVLREPGGTDDVATAIVIFTPADWSIPQVLTVLPVDDLVKDGDQTYTITVSVLSSTDPAYLELPVREIEVTNVDDDVPGFTITTVDGEAFATTSESGGGTSFSVRLTMPPSAGLHLPVRSSDITEAGVGRWAGEEVETVYLYFDAYNWDVGQTVLVSGVDDAIDDGNQHCAVVVGPPAGAPEYAPLLPKTLPVTNLDDDAAGITVTAGADPLLTSEGGATATFTVRLNTEPLVDVIVPVTSPLPSEGLLSSGVQDGLASITLTFTPSNWSTPQAVTITGQDEPGVPTVGDDVGYDVTVGPATGDPLYAALAAQTVRVLNVDNDAAAVVVPAVGGPALQTRESGARTATFTVSLTRAPTAALVVPVTVDDATEALLAVPGSPGVYAPVIVLDFTPDDWQSPRTVTVIGQADATADGNREYLVTVGTPTGAAEYEGLAPQQVEAINVDTDVAGFTVSATTISHTEAAAAATFTVSLNVMPAADVTIPVVSGSAADGLLTGGDSGGAAVPALTLTFTPADWSTPQTVQVTGPRDDVDDGDKTYAITVGPSQGPGGYAGLAAKTVAATAVDADSSAIILQASSAMWTPEAGGTGTFTVRLRTIPTGTVTLPVSVDDPSEALLSAGGSPAASLSLTFDASNWDEPQTVTVTGQQDSLLDGTRVYSITVGPPSGDDAIYNGLTPGGISGATADDEVGISEGTDTPVPVALDVPRESQVGPGSQSFYVVTAPAGATLEVGLAGVTADVSLTADDDGDYATGNSWTLAVTTAWEVRTGLVLVPAGGQVFLRVATSSSAGAGYRVTARRVYAALDLPKTIPDNTPAGVTSSIVVTDAPTSLAKVIVKVGVSHRYITDITLTLRSPAGTSVRLAVHNGGYGTTTFDDAAPDPITATIPYVTTYRPYDPLSTLNGQDANGTWQLTAVDSVLPDAGTLGSWSLEFQ